MKQKHFSMCPLLTQPIQHFRKIYRAHSAKILGEFNEGPHSHGVGRVKHWACAIRWLSSVETMEELFTEPRSSGAMESGRQPNRCNGCGASGPETSQLSLLLSSPLPLTPPLAEPNCKLEGLGAWWIQHKGIAFYQEQWESSLHSMRHHSVVDTEVVGNRKSNALDL